jgi:hypothetical protein
MIKRNAKNQQWQQFKCGESNRKGLLCVAQKLCVLGQWQSAASLTIIY